jgi:alcohol dehydrogenase
MKAIIRTKAGKEFSTMKVQDISSVKPTENEVKVKMSSSRINPVDMDLMKGMPFIKYKNPQIGGIDGAGTIIEIGKNVTNFKIGDNVFFYRLFTDIGSWANEITINEKYIAKIPNNTTVIQAGAVALPLLTAYDSLMQMNTKPNEKILIHGAGGGVGFQAVQIAKQMNLYVIATASDSDKSILEQAGVNKIINYKNQQFEQILKQSDVDYVFDVLGNDTLLKSIALKPKKIVSLKYIQPENMYKAGMNLPGILKWIMKLTMKKFDKAAKQNNVQLIGQVTGADGKLLQKASDTISKMNYINRNFPTLTISDIENKGLSKSDIGKIILFQ